MAGIAGIAAEGRSGDVEEMLAKMSYRGPAGRETLACAGATLGLAWPAVQSGLVRQLREDSRVADDRGGEHRAVAQLSAGCLTLVRDRLGVAPLYYGYGEDGCLAFASEAKALLTIVKEVRELPPGCALTGGSEHYYYRPHIGHRSSQSHSDTSQELQQRLRSAIDRRVHGDVMGAWLSGGLDSSAIAALARPRLRQLHTFSVGLSGAADLEYAQAVAAHIGSTHHERLVSLSEMLQVLPAVIYHLESFDALLVRSSLMNYLVAEAAADYVGEVFSGEVGDELFAGYVYLAGVEPHSLEAELVDILGRLHNTALQRVDRCAAAHGIVAHVPFADAEVVDYALSIPVSLKLKDGVGKWILRQALAGCLPAVVLARGKAKFWEGAGVGELLREQAEASISDGDFEREKQLPNGWVLASKEELVYYRVFREHFGELAGLDWMGRSKGMPAPADSGQGARRGELP